MNEECASNLPNIIDMTPELDDHELDETETECLSACCTDKTKAYQPTNKVVLSSNGYGWE